MRAVASAPEAGLHPEPPAASTTWQSAAVVRNVLACYFLSGALGLVYQILWLRKLLLVFGATVHAVSAVLTVFFGGLALGSWLFGRLIDGREAAGLRWYAALEAGIGVYAFATPWLFDAIRRVYIPAYQASGFSPTALVAASFACSVAILLLPTTLMGGTFPVLSRFLIRAPEERGAGVATLYGVNTIGAMAGTLAVYYLGLPLLGLWRTLVCAGVLNLGIGMLSLAFDRHLAQVGFRTPAARADAAAGEGSDRASGEVRWLWAAFAISGCSAMLYEVAWTRALSLVLGSSIYAFCIILATFLGGMALGSFWVGAELRKYPASLERFIRLELLLGAYGLMSLVFLAQLPEWFVSLWPLTGGSFGSLSWLQVTLSASVLLLPTLIMGVLFPLVSELATHQFAQMGRRLGTTYALNTVGGIVGSFLGGFLIIPLAGLPWAIIVAAMGNLAAGLLLFARFGRRWAPAPRWAASCAVVVGALIFSVTTLLSVWQRQVFAAGVYLNPDSFRATSVQQSQVGTELLYYKDSLNATVSVHRNGRSLFLKVGGKTDASNGIDMGTQVLSAHIPLLLHPDPKSVLVIGLGSGVTLGSAGRHPVEVLHCAELDPAVIEGARFFKEYNYGVHDDPRATIFAADGRNFLLASPRQYDVIISEPSNPWMAGLAYLFTKEFYELAKSRLAPHGVLCQWVQLYGIFPRDVKLMLKTFHAVFPHVSVWSSIPGDLLLVGSLEPQQLDYAVLQARMADPAVAQSLARVHAERPEALLHLFQFGTRGVEQLTADVTWVHEDDQPFVEFDAPKSLYARGMFALNYRGLDTFRVKPDAVIPAEAQQGSDADEALAALWMWREEPEKAKQALERALPRHPNDAALWRRLGEACVKMKEFVRAEEAWRIAISLDPTDAQAPRLLAQLQWKQGKAPEAAQWYQRAAALQAPEASTAEEIGDYMRETKQSAWAAEYYRSAVSQGAEDRASLLLAYADTLGTLREWAAAEQVLRAGLRVFPAQAAFPSALGKAFLEQERWRDAEPWLQQAVRLAPADAEAHYGLGRAAAAQGRTAQAVRHARRALVYNPYHREALRLLAQLQPSSP